MRVHLACSIWGRLRGLKRLRGFGGVLMLAPCRDVHTFGMEHPIDIAFVASEGRVVASYRGVPPGRRLRCRKAAVVLERFACKEPWPDPGDCLDMQIPCKGRGRSKKKEQAMKVCPTCQAVAFDDASVCYGCLHRFDGEQAEGGRSVHHAGAFAAEDAAMARVQVTETEAGSPLGAGAQPPGFCIRFTPTRGDAGAVVWDCAVELAS